MEWIGGLAALGTAISFAFGSTLFTLAGREIGSPLVHRSRLLAALLFIIGMHWLLLGAPFPAQAGREPWFWLGLSGFVGLALGDAALFQAFVMIGPRLSMLVMALAPVVGTVLAWMFLGESLALQELAGIVLTISGIMWVVLERQARRKISPSGRVSTAVMTESTRDYLIGLLFALGGALGQAGGLVLSKIGLANDFPALSGNLIRLLVAVVVMWALTALRGEIASNYRTLRQHPRALSLLSIGAFIGPAVGVWLSLVAVQRAPVGIASTLMSLTPIFLLPIGYVVFRETISRQAVIGTLIAFAGTALLFL